MTLSPIAETIIRKRYLIKDASGTPMERPEDMFRRVATTIAEIGLKYGETEDDVKLDARIFFDMMWNGLFVPNSPTLMNAGRPLGQLSACFVLPVEDDMTSIYDTLKHQALIHQSGGGTGFSFSRLRPKGDLVNSTSGVASGPVSFMDVYNHSTEAIKQGGTRRGANMGILRIDHPDILEFILCKQDTSKITNFNISVAVTDYFLDCLKTNQPYELMNPRTGKQFVPQQDMLHPLDGRLLNKAGAGAFLNSRMVWDLIIECAHRTGEPGLFFIDRANMFNPVPRIGQYEATNPCGEQPLLPYDVCNLGSINLGKFVLPAGPGVMPAVNWSALRDSIHMAVKFLDNVIDANRFPMPEITELSQRIRRIGLGVMGWADMLIKMGIPYNSFEAIKFAREVMKYVDFEAHMASEKLAEQRGNFPEWADSMWGPEGTRHPYTGMRIRQEQPQRNCNVTTVAPTGTISIMAGCSSGIEPIFAVAFWRNQAGEKMLDVSQEFVNHLVQAGVAHERLDGILQKVADTGHIHHAEIPEEVQRVWVTAHDIAPEWHVRMQAAFQEFCDSAISKTINLPHEATVEGVAAAYDLAITLRCKGITVYRDGSRNEQVLSTGKQDKVDTSTPGMTLLPEVGDEVIAHIQQELIDLIWAQHPMQPREIPRDGLPAFSFPVQTPIGKARIFVTEQDGRPFEVFTNIGKSGSDVVAFTEAIGRLISLALRVGIPVDLVAGQLMGIGGAKFIGFGKNRVKSVPDAIGQFLWNRYVQPEITREDREWLDAPLDTPPAKAQGDICPECHSASLMNEEGCRKCHNCGYAEC